MNDLYHLLGLYYFVKNGFIAISTIEKISLWYSLNDESNLLTWMSTPDLCNIDIRFLSDDHIILEVKDFNINQIHLLQVSNPDLDANNECTVTWKHTKSFTSTSTHGYFNMNFVKNPFGVVPQNITLPFSFSSSNAMV